MNEYDFIDGSINMKLLSNFDRDINILPEGYVNFSNIELPDHVKDKEQSIRIVNIVPNGKKDGVPALDFIHRLKTATLISGGDPFRWVVPMPMIMLEFF